MAKRIRFVMPLLLFALILVGASCNKEEGGSGVIEEGNDYTVYSNDDWGFKFRYSEDWNLEYEKESETNLAVAFNSPLRGGSTKSNAGLLIVAYIPEKGQIFSQESQKHINQLEANQILIVYSEEVVSRRNSYKAIYVDSPSDPKTRQLHYFVDGGDIWYQILYMAEQEVYNDYLEIVEEMVNSFEITT